METLTKVELEVQKLKQINQDRKNLEKELEDLCAELDSKKHLYENVVDSQGFPKKDVDYVGLKEFRENKIRKISRPNKK